MDYTKKEEVQKKLKDVDEAIEKTKNTFNQLLGMKAILEEILKQEDNNGKK